MTTAISWSSVAKKINIGTTDETKARDTSKKKINATSLLDALIIIKGLIDQVVKITLRKSRPVEIQRKTLT